MNYQIRCTMYLAYELSSCITIKILIVVLPIECEIPTLHMVVKLLLDNAPSEKRLISFEGANEHHQSLLQTNEAMKEHSKNQYDYEVYPHTFQKGDSLLVYDAYNETLALRDISTP